MRAGILTDKLMTVPDDGYVYVDSPDIPIFLSIKEIEVDEDGDTIIRLYPKDGLR